MPDRRTALRARARTMLVLAAAVFAAAALPAARVAANQAYQLRIPNGARVVRRGLPWPGVGHAAAAGGGALNAFGAAFAAAGYSWTAALCAADSDGDGYRNGEELGDPACQWSLAPGSVPARSTMISHPGYADSIPTPLGVPLPTTPTAASPASSSVAAGAQWFGLVVLVVGAVVGMVFACRRHRRFAALQQTGGLPLHGPGGGAPAVLGAGGGANGGGWGREMGPILGVPLLHQSPQQPLPHPENCNGNNSAGTGGFYPGPGASYTDAPREERMHPALAAPPLRAPAPTANPLLDPQQASPSKNESA